MKILITGASGLLGSALSAYLETNSDIELIKLTRADCNLLEIDQVHDVIKKHQPDSIFHCAAKVGGIGANKEFPVDFLVDNVSIQNNLFKAANDAGVKRVIFFASNAVYPKGIERPIRESDILTGQPEDTVRPYALAKLAGIELCHAYNKQYGTTKFIALIPVNLYGPNDNFHPDYSHVLPALIQKFYLAKQSGDNLVSVWGSGKQRREFMCSIDLARIAAEIMMSDENSFNQITEHYPPLINVGVGYDTNIKDLALLIAKKVGYVGDITFDSSKPEGILQKQTCIEKMSSLGYKHEIDLDEGLDIIINYYIHNVALKN